jgi:hypothetical protein
VGEAAAEPPARETASGSDSVNAPRKSRAWRWWLLGLVCAIGLGIFMWAVGGRWNVNAPRPSGPAATPQEAVQKFMAAVDNHDAGLAGSYAEADYVEKGRVDEWIDRAGYLRFVDVAVVSDTNGETIMRTRYDLATRFLDDDDPVGLNLAAVVWPERLTILFGARKATDGHGWLVSGEMDPLKP